ncbi:hypothetical protein K504DRAFT_452213 [Pleomassaria siparia CBS 279.74]|uniref:Uncharacterized protein n=1 Tax=Pleomassaria siparia CBS 279.74 TaxID=1314801 RepID=A0A6G1KGQ0_9PLEO|nr:hypothetical protein K504DRAFT_452213 [Pleomassaria siparia CBS 279.74]
MEPTTVTLVGTRVEAGDDVSVNVVAVGNVDSEVRVDASEMIEEIPDARDVTIDTPVDADVGVLVVMSVVENKGVVVIDVSNVAAMVETGIVDDAGLDDAAPVEDETGAEKVIELAGGGMTTVPEEGNSEYDVTLELTGGVMTTDVELDGSTSETEIEIELAGGGTTTVKLERPSVALLAGGHGGGTISLFETLGTGYPGIDVDGNGTIVVLEVDEIGFDLVVDVTG